MHEGRIAGELGNTQAAVLRVLRRRGSASRAELAAECGITPAAMSMITRQLVESRLIIEGARRQGGRGAPQIDLSLNAGIGHALGVHATRHTISLALLDFRGALLAETRRNGSFDRFADVCDTIEDAACALRGQSGIPLIGAGIAMPTRFHSAATDLDLAEEVVSWGGEDLPGTLQRRLGCPVRIENDANAAAMGELSLGKAANYGDFAYLYLSEGIGGAIVLNGQLHRGHLGNAGEVGAMRPRGGPRPSFEDFVAFCRQNGATPPDRNAAEWDGFLAAHQALVESWLERAVPEVARLVFAITAIVAPAAVFIGGTLPVSIRKAFVERIDLSRADLFGGGSVRQPHLALPAIDAKDAVAFGAAAFVLHLL